jgi:antitoxin component YwqK of YwqJK toxin-antitoxin module
MQFANGRPHGLRIEWYENGQKKEEGNFVNGNQHGKWTYYNKDGSIDGTEEY